MNETANTDIAVVELGSEQLRIRARGKFRDKDALDFVPTPESPHFYIDTPLYDGPLDLLLHLIRKHSMDIFDIPIFMITKKYLEALDEMISLNIDVAGEFLVMAATLAEIKSKMLLPKEEQSTDAIEEEAGLDPRQELIKRLLLYKSFKEASLELNQRPVIGRDIFFRGSENNPQEISPDETLVNSEPEISSVEIFELLECLDKVLKKSEQISIHTITRDRISVSQRMHELIDYCQLRSKFSFYEALQFFPIYEKIDIIITFLALLEMSRLKLIIIQSSLPDDLIINIIKENFYQKHKEILQNIDNAKGTVNYD